MQNTTAAYPRPVADLVPGALALADQLGEIPSRNRLMREFKIGAPKADAIRAELAAKTETDPGTPEPVQDVPAESAAEPIAQVTADGHPGTETVPAAGRRAVVWPVVLLALPAFVAIWSGWVGLGGLTGFGVVHPLPGIADGFSINTAITLPIGVETYGAYALYVWLSGRVPGRVRRFAKWSAIASLVVGALGQVAYHLLVAAGITSAPWWITTAVACLPVAVLGMGAALAHLVREGSDQ
ncbi:ABC transporter permease [Micromonospora arborensis]|uniref:ABC transporter permease n=1 Tax=Micromonospora arborensis TaxID=2116518 RepID=UPI003711317B